MRKTTSSAIFYFYICCIMAVSDASATTYEINDDVVGEIQHYNVKAKEDLYVIAQRFDIGIVELLSANPGVNIWKPKEGTTLTIPTSHILPDELREGIVVNLSELRLFYFPDEQHVMTFPIAIGRKDWETQQGITKIVMKRAHPTWTPPESIREENPDLPDVIPAGIDNPLGEYAMTLGWTNYIIHGTNKPFSVGKRASHGCLRLYPEDIKKLFEAAKLGTKVNVIDTSYKLGWHDDNLLLEVLPTQEQADIIVKSKIPEKLEIPDIHDAIRAKAGENTEINWELVDELVKSRSGVPTIIAKKRGGLLHRFIRSIFD